MAISFKDNPQQKRAGDYFHSTLQVQQRKGFTLIELLVGVAVFTFVVAITTELFVTAIRVQRRVLAQQELVDQVSYIMEYMSRALRTAQKELDDPPSCLITESGTTPGGKGYNYQLTRFNGSVYTGIRFINDSGECQEFFLDTGAQQLKEQRAGSENVINSSAIQIVKFTPVIAGESQTDSLQPRVTFLLEAQRNGTRPEERQFIRIQTTVSQRNLDIQLSL
jgi:prepilin-type N-terminal cleavage/methylation domain-containing protein